MLGVLFGRQVARLADPWTVGVERRGPWNPIVRVVGTSPETMTNGAFR